MNKRLLAAGVLLLLGLGAHAGAPVYRVRHGDHLLYLGGTCHFLRPEDLPLPAAFDRAYQDAALLVFETDLADMLEPATQLRMTTHSMYPDASTLDQHLSPEVHRELVAYCQANGIPLRAIDRLRPAFAAATLAQLQLMKWGANPVGVDLRMFRRARQDDKPCAGLETVDQHLAFLLKLGEEDEDAMIREALVELRDGKADFLKMMDAWKAGDEARLEAFMIDKVKKEAPEAYQLLLVDRNRNWMPAIEAYLRTPQREFILVGAAHLVGPDGLLHALKKKGYQVEKLANGE